MNQRLIAFADDDTGSDREDWKLFTGYGVGDYANHLFFLHSGT